MTTYMLDTNICSFIMREHPASVIDRLGDAVMHRSRIVISAITYAEMRYGAANPKSSPKIDGMIDAFIKRLDAILPWDATAIDQTAIIRKALYRKGTPIGDNDSSIAGHALAADCILVTNNTREFSRVEGLRIEDWREG
ncbi:type II toxin-antitoxin system VapC family toxin [Brucella oryzae]|uniref:type II toxin-antitoxin system VapC family toxin n=1 Tax=Brucella oryzae TaxID=335286 RepID=UPI001B80FA13|nr:type II toxin-antitoxin system VapC family toxin [Brucella oryzae]MBR7653752.1 type II toxin-antitoxin system VapC family toxin [Brucella oryzae]